MTRWIWNRTQGIVTDFSGYTLADHLTMDARREELKAIAAGCRCVGWSSWAPARGRGWRPRMGRLAVRNGWPPDSALRKGRKMTRMTKQAKHTERRREYLRRELPKSVARQAVDAIDCQLTDAQRKAIAFRIEQELSGGWAEMATKIGFRLDVSRG